MSYGTKYRTSVVGLDGQEWRVTLSLQGYSGGVSALDAAANFIELFWGDRSDDQITTTHLPGRLILRISDPAGTLWQEFVNATNRTWQVQVQRRDIGSSIWKNSFFGLYVPDTFVDDETDIPNVVRIEFRDGLTLLEDEPFVDPETAEDDLGSVTVTEALHRVFSTLPYQRQFNVIHSLFPYKEDGAQLDGTTDPFSLLTFEEAGLLDDQRLVRSGSLSKKDVLLELCAAFGCSVVQSEGLWWIRQHAHLAKENGQNVRIWRYRGDTGALLSSGTTSLVRDLSGIESRRGRPRFSEQRFTQADVSFEASTNDAISDILFLEETWENTSGSWLTEDSWVFEEISSTGTHVERKLWDFLENSGFVDIRSAVGDVNGLWLRTDSQFVSPYARTEGIGSITEQIGDAFLKVAFDVAHNKGRNTVRFRADIGDYYLTTTPVEVRGRYRGGEVELRVEALPGDGVVLHEGQVVPMTTATVDPSGGNGVATFTVSEDALAGDHRVKGRLSDDMMDLSFSSGNFPQLLIYHWAFDDGSIPTAQKWMTGLRHLPADFAEKRLSGVEMLLPTTTLQGEKVTGPLTCYWGVRKHSTMSGDVDVAVGDISIGLEAKSGSGLTFTRRASLDAEGESVSIESIFGDRISSAAPRGFALVDGAYNQPIVNDWRLDPYPGFLPNGDPLTDLSAKSIVAASTGAKRTAELLPRDGQMVLPHEVLEWRDIFSHTRQTLTELVYLPFQGVYETTMQALSWDSVAFSVATLTTPEEEETSGAATRNFVVSSAINLSGSGASTWDQLAGKPSGLFAANGGTDGIAETAALTKTHITDRLGSSATEWDTAYDRSVTGISGDGNSVISVSRQSLPDLTTDLSHAHNYADLPFSAADKTTWDDAYGRSPTGLSVTGSGRDVTVAITRENLPDLSSTGSITLEALSPGNGINGSSYDGSTGRTWNLDEPWLNARFVESTSLFEVGPGNRNDYTYFIENNRDGGTFYINANEFTNGGGMEFRRHESGANFYNILKLYTDGDVAIENGDLTVSGNISGNNTIDWDTAYDRSPTGLSATSSGLQVNLALARQATADLTASATLSIQNLSTGTGLNGATYNGTTSRTFSLDTTYTDNRYANLTGDTFTGSVNFGDFLTANTGKARFEVYTGVNLGVAMGFLDGVPKNDGNGNWGSADRGFWVRQGDHLVIDGDVEYENGDWLIENDASLRIQDGITGDDILVLGTHSGDKGLFLFDGAGAVAARFSQTGALVSGDALVDGTVTASKLQIGSITEIDANAALVSDIITDYGSLSGRPTLGNLAALSEVDSTTIAGGSIITSKIAANAVDASKASFGDLDAVAASIGGWTITSSRLYNGDVSLYSSNGGRIEAGGSSNVVGMTGDGNGGSSIALWAGGLFSGRNSAPFRVTRDGDVTMNNGTIGGNVTISGTLSGADGTFSGSLSAATGTFSGSLSAATGTFSGDLSAATGTFSGDLQAAGGTFSGNLSAAGGTFSGDLQAAGGSFSGSLSAASGTFSGSLSAATGSLGSLDVDGRIDINSGTLATKDDAYRLQNGGGLIIKSDAGSLLRGIQWRDPSTDSIGTALLGVSDSSFGLRATDGRQMTMRADGGVSMIAGFGSASGNTRFIMDGSQQRVRIEMDGTTEFQMTPTETEINTRIKALDVNDSSRFRAGLRVDGSIDTGSISTQGTLDLSGLGGVDVSFGGLTIEDKTVARLQDHLSFSVGDPSTSSGQVGDIRTANNGVWIKVETGTWLKLTVEKVVT